GGAGIPFYVAGLLAMPLGVDENMLAVRIDPDRMGLGLPVRHQRGDHAVVGSLQELFCLVIDHGPDPNRPAVLDYQGGTTPLKPPAADPPCCFRAEGRSAPAPPVRH